MGVWRVSIKRVAALAMALFLLPGCGASPADAPEAEEREPVFVFASDPKFQEDVRQMTLDEMFEYRDPKLDPYNARYYFEQLDGRERLMYNALLYLSEQGIEYVRMPISPTQEELDLVLRAAGFDSPFCLAGLAYDAHLGASGGSTIRIRCFQPNQRELYLESIRASEQILAQMREEGVDGDYEQAHWLYEQLVEQVRYNDRLMKEDTCFLHRTLCGNGREAHCEGFSSALTLLLNGAGIPCFKAGYSDLTAKAYIEQEKAYTGMLETDLAKLEDAPGHVWNVAEIDGAYYFLDASDGAEYFEKIGIGELSFCFDNDLVKAPLYEEPISKYLPEMASAPKGSLPYIPDAAMVDHAAIQNLSNLLSQDGYVFFFMDPAALKGGTYLPFLETVVGNTPGYSYSINLIKQTGGFLFLIYQKPQ